MLQQQEGYPAAEASDTTATSESAVSFTQDGATSAGDGASATDGAVKTEREMVTAVAAEDSTAPSNNSEVKSEPKGTV